MNMRFIAIGGGLIVFGIACGMGISTYAATIQNCYFPGSMETIVCEDIEIADPVMEPEPTAILANDPAPTSQPVEKSEPAPKAVEPISVPVQVQPTPVEPCISK